MVKTIVIKYGGNAMNDEEIKVKLIKNICKLKDKGHRIVIIHGGGPFIKQALAAANIQSKFVDGQRETSPEALKYVEMTLKGKVNADLVRLINANGHNAVGLSGKDGKLVIAKKRFHHKKINGKIQPIDLGRVGDVKHVNPELLYILLNNNYVPVLTCLASDDEGTDFNINADVFAGHIAGAINATDFVLLTDVDGLMRDVNTPGSLIERVNLSELQFLTENKTIEGGMIPKLEACKTALLMGAKNVRIMNGTKPDQILNNFQNNGTLITH